MKIEDIAKELNECWEMEVNKNDTTTELAKKLSELKYKVVKNCSIPNVVGQSEQLVCECDNQTIELNDKNNHQCLSCGELIFKAN